MFPDWLDVQVRLLITTALAVGSLCSELAGPAPRRTTNNLKETVPSKAVWSFNNEPIINYRLWNPPQVKLKMKWRKTHKSNKFILFIKCIHIIYLYSALLRQSVIEHHLQCRQVLEGMHDKWLLECPSVRPWCGHVSYTVVEQSFDESWTVCNRSCHYNEFITWKRKI